MKVNIGKIKSAALKVLTLEKWNLLIAKIFRELNEEHGTWEKENKKLYRILEWFKYKKKVKRSKVKTKFRLSGLKQIKTKIYRPVNVRIN